MHRNGPARLARHLLLWRGGHKAVPIQRLATMHFRQFLIGMTATSASVALAAYFRTGSPWVGLAWAAASAILLQAGYFMLIVREVYRPAISERTAANKDAHQPEVRVPAHLLTLVAIAVLASAAMTQTTLADDDDTYFDCVIGKAEAIMKRQTHRDAEAALGKAYALCQPMEPSQEAFLSPGPAATG
ncbi:hypothetical protein EN851_14280 [Mesorhizobium sp. M8A.F.Ca.ET.208.01.1.1]|nr:hypothetical protein EN851_14280 [Mesorhizobium sp. M8A.F.Ca.ET.208.01.1.1]TGT52612.1 hypothetical protein EN810_14270 [Mesorhizobium sp. M8A.F.Ca.ET.167.01.1.1]